MVPPALLVITVSIAADCGHGLDGNVTCLKHIAVTIIVLADQSGGTDTANVGGAAKGFGPCGGVMVGVDGGQPLWGGGTQQGWMWMWMGGGPGTVGKGCEWRR